LISAGKHLPPYPARIDSGTANRSGIEKSLCGEDIESTTAPKRCEISNGLRLTATARSAAGLAPPTETTASG